MLMARPSVTPEEVPSRVGSAMALNTHGSQ
jgi:hypothetical protein